MKKISSNRFSRTSTVSTFTTTLLNKKINLAKQKTFRQSLFIPLPSKTTILIHLKIWSGSKASQQIFTQMMISDMNKKTRIYQWILMKWTWVWSLKHPLLSTTNSGLLCVCPKKKIHKEITILIGIKQIWALESHKRKELIRLSPIKISPNLQGLFNLRILLSSSSNLNFWQKDQIFTKTLVRMIVKNLTQTQESHRFTIAKSQMLGKAQHRTTKILLAWKDHKITRPKQAAKESKQREMIKNIRAEALKKRVNHSQFILEPTFIKNIQKTSRGTQWTT